MKPWISSQHLLRSMPTRVAGLIAAAALGAAGTWGAGMAQANAPSPGQSPVQQITQVYPSSQAPASEPTITQRGALSQFGRWYLDGDGRAFLTSGVNMVYKHAPYTPEAGGFNEDDADWLADNGFDSVRLGIIWKAVEPEPGVYDDSYLDSILATTRLLADRGIMTLIDAHQDMYNEKFEGEFAPDWAVIDDGVPSLLQVGFPTNQVVNIGLLRAYDNFLANREGPGGVGLQDRYAAMWGHIAERFAGQAGVMGFDIMNEPWPGSAFPLCYLAGGNCERAISKLDQLHQKSADAITRVDPEAIVHYEPYSMWNQGFNTHPSAPEAKNTALSWHVYCTTNALFNSYLGCQIPDGMAFNNADKVSQAQGSASLLSEFGATDDRATLEGVLGFARQHLTGWQYWSYCGCNDPTTQNQLQQGIVADPTVQGPVMDDAVNQDKLAILAAPHLRAAAGTPKETSWDAASLIYQATWSTEKAAGHGDRFAPGSVSEIAVPMVNFPNGYHVEVIGGHVVSEPGAPRLLIATDTEDAVSVTITPAA